MLRDQPRYSSSSLRAFSPSQVRCSAPGAKAERASRRAEPNNELFDPLKAAILHQHRGNTNQRTYQQTPTAFAFGAFLVGTDWVGVAMSPKGQRGESQPSLRWMISCEYFAI
jgi:hypothetical protein